MKLQKSSRQTRRYSLVNGSKVRKVALISGDLGERTSSQSNAKIPLTFCHGYQGDVNFVDGLQKKSHNRLLNHFKAEVLALAQYACFLWCIHSLRLCPLSCILRVELVLLLKFHPEVTGSAELSRVYKTLSTVSMQGITFKIKLLRLIGCGVERCRKHTV